MHNQTGILSKGLSYLLMFLVSLQPTLAEAQQGKIVVDPNSSAQIDQTFNKTPLLQIERPNASGVSHSKFTDFNVGSKGLVINNALKETISKTGGAIFKNPNFQGRAASLILNEVTSSNRSSLNGFTEIAGQKADYILANPNGITCNGCGFINTSRSTLTTGTPVFNGTSLEQLSVDQGDVLIEGLGLNAEGTDAFDIITRSTKLMAQLNAKDVNIITGRNEVTYQDRAVTAKTDDGSVKPSLAIDSSTLGGMYAGRISLVATEHGLGVNMQGDMAASASDLSISADGKILVTNVQSQNNLTLQSKNNAVTLSGNASAKGKIELQAKGDVLAQNNRVTATSDISINAQNIDVAGAKVIAGVNDAGDVQKGQGNLKLTARDTLTYGAAQLAAGKDLSITAQTVDSGDASQGLTSKGSLTVDATTMSKTSGGIVSEGDLSLKVTSLGLTDTGVTSKAALNVRTNDFTNSAQLSSVGDLAFNVSGAITNEAGAKIDSDGTLSLTSTGASITNRGMLRGKQAVNLDAATFITNESTGSVTSGGTLKLDAKGGALQNSGTIETTGDMTAQASTNILNNNGAKLAATGTLNSTAAGDFTNSGVYAGLAEQTITANNLTNTGILKSDGNLTANVSNNLTNSQTIKARGDLTLYVANQVQNDQGTIKGNTGVVIQKNAANEKTTLIENISGTIQAGHDTSTNADVVLRAETLNNRKKTFAIGVRNDGSRGEGGGNTTVRYDVQEVTSDSDAARILAERDITLYGGNITNSQSQIHANRNVDLAEGNFTNETQELTTTRVATTVRRWTTKKCNSFGWNCKTQHHSSTSTDTQLQANETQTVYGTLSARDTISTDVGTLAITGVSQGVERVGLVAGDTNTAVSGASGLAAAANTNISITLPTGQYGEFITKKGAGFKYLVETNPELVDMATFMGSEYFISKAGFDPNALAKRLGDAAYETHLITKEIFKRTGQRFLSDAVTNNADQMQRLMDAAAIEQTNLNLSFGVELSAAQVAALTSDIIWMVEREVEGETVLVPELYLASVTRDNLSKRGSAIVASNLNIKAVDLVMKNGRLEGKNSVILNTTGSVLNRGGVISSDGNVQVASLGDINIQSGQIEGDAVTLQAANDINIDTVNTTVKKGINDDNLLNQQAALTSKSDLVVTAGRDLGLKGAKLTSEGKATLSSKGDTNIQTAQYRDSYDANMGAVIDRRHEVKNLGSGVAAKDDLVITSEKDLALTGSTLAANQNVDIDAKGTISVASAQDTLNTYFKMETDNGGFFGGSSSTESKSSQTTQVSSGITAGGNLTVEATDNVNITASNVRATNDVSIKTDKNLNITSAANSTSSSSKTSSSSGFSLGIVNYSSQKGAENDNRKTTNVASTLQGQNVTLETGEDLGIKGSQVTANNDATIKVAGNLNVENASNTTETSSSSYKSKSISANIPVYFFDVNVGHNSAATKENSVSEKTVVASAVKAGNDLNASVGKDATIVGSDIQAGNNLDLNVTGDLALATAQNVRNESHSESKQSGFSVGVSYAGYGANVGQTKNEATQTSTLDVINDGTVLKADQNLNIKADNISVVSGELTSGQNTTLDANKDLTLASAQDIHQTSTSKTTGTTRTAGVSYGTSYGGDTGANVKVGLNVSKGTETTKTSTVTDTVQKGTQLTSGKNITITSGNDTTLVNTDVKASGQTNINAGGDVNLLAAADTHEVTNTTSTTKTSSIGVTAGVSANVANDGLSTDGSFTTGTLNTGLTQTKSKTTTTSTTTTTTTEKGTTIRSDGGTVVVAANNVDVENTTTTGDVLTAGDTVTAGGAVNETTLEDTSETVTTTTSTSSTSTKFSGPDIKQAALDTVANAVGEVGANKIGDLKADGLDTVTHKALHAANGAVQGAIKSGGDLYGAAAGAIGAAVGEIVAEVVDDGTATRTNEKGQQVTKVASIAAQIAAGLAGKDTEIASGAATNAVQNNRLLHVDEAEVLVKLKEGKSEKEKRKLDAAACAQVRCADGVSENDPDYADLKQLQNEGEALKTTNDPAYQAIFAQRSNGFFDYTFLNQVDDLTISNEQAVSRVLGGIQTGSAAVGTVAGVTITVGGAASCPTTGVGCLVTVGGVALTAMESQRFVEGLKQAATLDYQYAGGQRVKDSFDPATHRGNYSPVSDALISAGISIAETGAGKLAIKTGKVVIETSQVAARALDGASDYIGANLNKVKDSFAKNTPLPKPRTVDNLKGGPLENATKVSGRFKLESGPPNGTVYRADNQGNITSYATYDQSGRISTRVDVTGAAHNGIPTPHVLEYGRNKLPDGSIRVQTPRTDPRPATSKEIP
ncbi:hemagglutinin repeat-containing protein [Terasakiella pusilla]|uniref:two-partner secretion domain-containing protein n=1 Tax=Terasakiella pusilla TaxID=64973 RepID=UPI003AA87970